MEVCEPIKLPFGVVYGVCPDIYVQNGVHMAQGKGVDLGVVFPHWRSGFSGLIFKRNVFSSCV